MTCRYCGKEIVVRTIFHYSSVEKPHRVYCDDWHHMHEPNFVQDIVEVLFA